MLVVYIYMNSQIVQMFVSWLSFSPKVCSGNFNCGKNKFWCISCGFLQTISTWALVCWYWLSEHAQFVVSVRSYFTEYCSFRVFVSKKFSNFVGKISLNFENKAFFYNYKVWLGWLVVSKVISDYEKREMM